jgi:hypothetical protein
MAIFLIFAVSTSVVSCGGKKQTRDSSKKSSSSKNKMRAQETGYAMIYDGDTALARDRATDDAKSGLVKKVLGESVRGTTTMENYELVSSVVEAKSFGLVKDTKVIKQSAVGNEFSITIEGTVELSAVEDAIEDALARYGKPKFMVLVEETFEGQQNQPGFTETETVMQDIMGNLGFEFVDAQTVQDLMRRERATMANAVKGNVNDDVQKLLLNTIGAEVIIVGKSVTMDQSATLREYGVGNMKSKQANIIIKAIDLYTGGIIATKSLNAPAIHIEPRTASKLAIEKALMSDKGLGKTSPGEFTRNIITKFTKAATNRQINILITGLDYYGLKKFRNQLEQRVRGIKSVNPKGQVGTAARLEVYFAGKTHDFIDELQGKGFDMGFNIEIKENYPNRVVLNVTLAK